MSITVFVSSTVFDLVDLRSEVYHELLAHGFDVIMSDRPESSFQVDGRADTLQTCLVNIRNCDVFVLILSQRYGYIDPFSNISYTHLEYLEAVKQEKSILFFVRDSTLADYNNWNPEYPDDVSRLKYISNENIHLFDIISDRKSRLDSTKRPRWIDTYRSSFDLRTNLMNRLDSYSGTALLNELHKRGVAPALRIKYNLDQCQDSPTDKIILAFKPQNIGSRPIINGKFCVQYDDTYNILGLAPGEDGSVIARIPRLSLPSTAYNGDAVNLDIQFSYDIYEGIRIRDVFEAKFYFKQKRGHDIILKERQYIGKSEFSIKEAVVE